MANNTMKKTKMLTIAKWSAIGLGIAAVIAVPVALIATNINNTQDYLGFNIDKQALVRDKNNMSKIKVEGKQHIISFANYDTSTQETQDALTMLLGFENNIETRTFLELRKDTDAGKVNLQIHKYDSKLYYGFSRGGNLYGLETSDFVKLTGQDLINGSKIAFTTNWSNADDVKVAIQAMVNGLTGTITEETIDAVLLTNTDALKGMLTNRDKIDTISYKATKQENGTYSVATSITPIANYMQSGGISDITNINLVDWKDSSAALAVMQTIVSGMTGDLTVELIKAELEKPANVTLIKAHILNGEKVTGMTFKVSLDGSVYKITSYTELADGYVTGNLDKNEAEDNADYLNKHFLSTLSVVK